MKNKNRMFFIAALALMVAACNKESVAPTALSIHCMDGQAYPVSGSSVSLYNDYTDFLNNTNVAASGITDANGNVSFSPVNSQVVYYYSCTNQANCLLNWTTDQLSGALTPNQTTSINVIMTGYGTLTVTNTSPGQNPYEIKLNGQVWAQSLGYGQYISATMPLGNATVEAIQLSGYVSYPTDVTYNVPVQQCQVTNQNIP